MKLINIDISKINYSMLDKPEVTMFLFHPRTEGRRLSKDGIDIQIPTEKDIVIGSRFFMIEQSAPNILFFHGNGEIVGDYDDLVQIYNQMNINFLPVDYRGYGRSSGRPTVTGMMRDCHMIFVFVENWLKKNNYTGSIIVMGRSLGSASALELAAHYKDRIGALIIESGFAFAGPLLKLIGIDIDRIGFKEKGGFENIDKIKKFDKPTLIIHAEYDHIIPFSDGQALYEACPSSEKTLLKIPGANHNNIFALGMSEYMSAIQDLRLTIKSK